MNLLERAKTALHVFRHGTKLPYLLHRGGPGTLQRKDAPYLWPDFRSGVPQWKMFNYETYVNEGFNQNALIYSAIMYKVRAARLAPLRAWSGDLEDRELLDEGAPLQQLVSRPNHHQSWIEFQDQAIVYSNISGNNFTFLDRSNPKKLPDAMLNLRPDRVFIVPGQEDGSATILGYLYVPEGKSALGRMTPEMRAESFERGGIVPILPGDMMHVKLPNPLDPLEGMGEGFPPISPIAWTTDVDNAVTQFLKLFFEKGIVIPGMVTTDKANLSEGTIARLKARWKEIYGGFENWGNEIFVADHGLKYQRIGLTFDEMGFKEIDARSESRILAPFGVPGALIGTRLGLDRAIQANMVELRKMFWQDTMMPESLSFQTEFQYYLRGDGGEFVAYDYSKVPALQEVLLDVQAQRLEDFKAGAITRNEYRQALRLADDPHGDVYVIPLSLIEMPFGAVAEPEPTMEEAPEAEEDSRKILTLPLKKKGISHQAKQFLWKQVDDIATSWERRYSSRAKKAFENDRRAVLARLQKAKRQALEQKQSVDWRAVNRDWDNYFETQAPENWREEFLPVIEGLVVDQGQAWNTAFGMQFNVRNLFAEEWFRDYTLEFSQDINNTTKDNLSVMLEQGMREGWTIDQARKQIDLQFDRYTDPSFTLDGRRLTDQERQWFEDRSPRYRREMIARTETIRASNAGSMGLFKAWGVVEKKEWLATGDDRTRDSHLDAWARYSEGGTPGPIPLGSAFNVGGRSLMYPGDPRGPASETVNCRCVPLPFFAEAAGTAEQIAEQQAAIEAEQTRRQQLEAQPSLQYLPDAASVEKARDYAWHKITEVAAREGIAPEEVEKIIRGRLSQDLQNPVAIRRGQRGALGVLDSERFKTQFETGTSGGTFSPEMREGAEKFGLGTPFDIDPEKRPVYGYVATQENNAHYYGGVEFVLKENVKERATMTLGDTMSQFRAERAVGIPYGDSDTPGWGDYTGGYFKHGTGKLGTSYLEVQIQNGISLDDIIEVVIHSQDPDMQYAGVREAAEAHGLRVRIDGETP